MATHEAGHAVCRLFCPHTPPIERITIRGDIAVGARLRPLPGGRQHRRGRPADRAAGRPLRADGRPRGGAAARRPVAWAAGERPQAGHAIARALVEVFGMGGADASAPPVPGREGAAADRHLSEDAAECSTGRSRDHRGGAAAGGDDPAGRPAVLERCAICCWRRRPSTPRGDVPLRPPRGDGAVPRSAEEEKRRAPARRRSCRSDLMAEMTIRPLRPGDGQERHYHQPRSDEDALPHAHEQQHRALVDKLIEGGRQGRRAGPDRRRARPTRRSPPPRPATLRNRSGRHNGRAVRGMEVICSC